MRDRELDALIAEKVMRWKRSEKYAAWPCGKLRPWPHRTYWDTPGGQLGYIGNLPAYSTDIAAAWSVVEEMRERGWSFRYGNNGCASDQHAAAFAQSFRGLGAHILTGDYIEADDAVAVTSTAPLAICRAALRALGVDVA